MKKKLIFLILWGLISSASLYAQNVGINTTGADPNASAALDIDAADKGLLVPRIALTGSTDASSITAGNVNSLLVYNTASVSDVTPGFYYWSGTVWLRLTTNADATTDTDDQTLILTGTSLEIVDGNTVDLSGINTDEQTISLSGTTLTIVGGNSVDLASLQDGFEADTDDQTLSLSGTDLSISEGNTVSLSALGADNLGNHIATQNIELSGNWLSGDSDSEGVFVATDGKIGLGRQDNLIAPIHTQGNIRISGNQGTSAVLALFADDPSNIVNNNHKDRRLLVSDPSDHSFSVRRSAASTWVSDMVIDSLGNVGIGTTTPDAKLEVAGQVKITGGTPGAGKVLTSDADGLASWADASVDTDDQTLILTGTTLEIVDGNSVDLASLQDGFEADTDDQTLSLSGTDLSISEGNTVSLSALGDDDFWKDSLYIRGTDTLMIVKDNGNVGIGTISPHEKLVIKEGASLIKARFLENSGSYRSVLTSTSDDPARGGGIEFNTLTNSVANVDYNLWFNYRTSSGALSTAASIQSKLISGGTTSDDLKARISIINKDGNIVLSDNGNVGIGTTTPDAKLEVAGQVKITGGTPGAGKVLTSDADGLATWEVASTNDDDFWIDSLYIRGTDTLMVVKDNGKVGIGTVALNSLIPSKLEVNGSTLSKYATKTYRVNGSAAIEAFRLNGTLESPTQVLANQPILYLPAYSMNSSGGWNYNGGMTVYASEDQTTTGKGSYISFFTQENAGGGVATRMRISDNGNVGIGTTTPEAKLHLIPDANEESMIIGATGSFTPGSFDGSVVFTQQNSGNGDDGILWMDSTGNYLGGIFGNAYGDRLQIGTVANKHIELAPGGSNGSGTGNVGINTATPLEKLHVWGGHVLISDQTQYTNRTSQELRADNIRPYADKGTRIYDGNSNSHLTFYSYGPSHIQSYGTSGAAPDANVDISGTESVLSINPAGGYVGIGTSSPTATLSVNGTANKPGGGSWAVFSDARSKENVKDYVSGLEQIMKLRPVSFKYKEKFGWGTATHVGLIAQEVEKVAPSMVSEKAVEGIQDFKEVDPNELTYMLINAVQEQQKIIKTLETRIAELESK